jgi:hypothetical protein
MLTSHIVARVLQEKVPTATDDQVRHQMEYIHVRLRDGKYVIEGDYKSKPHLLHAFYGLDSVIFPALQSAVDAHYKEEMGNLSRRVQRAMMSLMSQKVSPDTVWLDMKRMYPTEGHYFLGLEIRYHQYSDEFVADLALGRTCSLEHDDGKVSC